MSLLVHLYAGRVGWLQKEREAIPRPELLVIPIAMRLVASAEKPVADDELLLWWLKSSPRLPMYICCHSVFTNTQAKVKTWQKPDGAILPWAIEFRLYVKCCFYWSSYQYSPRYEGNHYWFNDDAIETSSFPRRKRKICCLRFWSIGWSNGPFHQKEYTQTKQQPS